MKRSRSQPRTVELEKLTSLFNQGLATEAEQFAIDLTARFPAHGFAWKVLSVIQLESKRFSDALDSAKRAVKLLPNDAAVHNNLGNVYLRLERFEEAEPHFRESLSIAPDYTKALFNFASLMRFNGKLKDSEKYCRQALTIDPTYTNAHIALGNALELQNKLSEARISYHNALALAPDMANLHTDVLHLLSLDVSVEPHQLIAEHAAFGTHFEAPFLGRYPAPKNTKDPERNIHVGFVTADLNNHALANFLEPLFQFLSQKPRLTLYVYYTKKLEDAVTQRFKMFVPYWNSVADLSDEELSEKIRTDSIDILIDLGGHTVLNRLTTFARKPAPVQASWLGYLGTTGLQAMDYYVCDTFWLPPGELDWQFSEKLAYLPSAMVFLPHPSAPPINELPALKSGHITFGSFNRYNKINDSIISLWSALLRAVPNSHMALCAIPKEFEEDTVARFAQEGVERERLTFFPRTSQIDYLALHHQVDFCLDTFPHGGGATVAHAAWMGVPTLCLSGESPASRFGATEMHHLGLDGFIAKSIEEFVEKGCFWAEDLTNLSTLRQTMRTRFQESALGQHRSFADHFEALLRTMWVRWCKGLPPAPIEVYSQCLKADLIATSSPLEPSPRELDALSSLHRQQKFAEVEPMARQLAKKYPDHGLAWKILGSTLHELGRLEESLEVQIQITGLRPDDHEAHFNLACEYQQQGQLDEAVKSYIQCLSLRPDNANAYLNVSSLLKTMGLSAESEMYARQAIALQPDMATAHNNLGNALHGQGKFIEAADSYRQSLKFRPHCAETYNNLAITLKDQGYWLEANNYLRRALEIKPAWAAVHSNLLYCMSHDVQIDPQELHIEHLKFGEIFEIPLRSGWAAHANDKDPVRMLRIGFVSADFYDHALANFLEPVFDALSKLTDLVMHAYYTHVIEDKVTRRMQKHFAGWHKVEKLSQSELAALISKDRIDILVDLTGHTAHNRLLTFARKPAPIQVSWLGYLGTTGLQAMDYYLCDKFWVPPGESDWQFTEKMAYLPSAVCFLPNEHSPDVNLLPALSNGHITFGSFNRPNKLNASVIVLWSMLLQKLPSARMILGGIPPDSEQTLRELFAQDRIDQDRIVFYPRTNLLNYLSLHHEVDLCLDSFPYGGGATTANAAWMGVPTLSLAGETPPSRFGAAAMHQLGLDEFIAGSIDEYLAKGRYWATHIEKLAAIRRGMRERFNQSPLGQHSVFADNLSSMFRVMWQRWCSDLPASQIEADVSGKHSTSVKPQQQTEPMLEELETLAALHNQKCYPEAEELSRLLVDRFPNHGFAWKILAYVYQAQARYEDSLLPLQKAIDHGLEDASICNNLGVALSALDRHAEAEVTLKKAIAIAPDYGKALVNLGMALRFQGKLQESEASCRRALALDPCDAAAYVQLGNVLEDLERLSEAQACYYRADMAHEPRRAVAHSNVLYLMTHDVLVEPEHLFAEHVAFGEQFEAPLRAEWQTHKNIKDPARCLQVGFVSGDFCHHALADFLNPAFTFLARKQGLSLHAYYTGTRDDAVTQLMRGYFTHWHPVASLDDAALAEAIRADRIDILIDLSGHTANNRLLTFARKPAPIQASWLGYLGSTGLQAMDYYLCDKFWIPPGELDWQFSEKPAYLPTAVVFQPSIFSPAVQPLPALNSGYVTFGSFNRSNKINESVIVLWATLLRNIPSSRLILGAIQPEQREELIQSFSREDIDPTRLTFYSRTHTTDYQALHHQIDFCLDTFPHGGGGTTAHAAWMGVPTLCLAGVSPASRFSATLMHHLDLDDFIAVSIDDYVAKGQYWAEHTVELSSIRMKMRDRFKESTFGRPEVFATGFETMLRNMWTNWCNSAPAHRIESDDNQITLDLRQANSTKKEARASAIKTFCIAHKALDFPVPEDMTIIWLGTASVQTHGQHLVHHVADISEEFDAMHNFLGGSAGSFAIEKIISENLIKWSSDDRVSIFQYRKFMACQPIGTPSENYPGMYMLNTVDALKIDLRNLHDVVKTPYLLPQPLNVGNLYIQYSISHSSPDLLRYIAIAIELKVINWRESQDFLNSTHIIPGGVEFGIYPIIIFLKIISFLRKISMKFLANHNPTILNSFQRRALSFCNERLGSYLLLRELNQEYNGNIPIEFFGYIHTVTEGNVYCSGLR